MAKERQKTSDRYRSIAARMAQEAGVVGVVENRRKLHGCAYVELRAIQVPPPNTLRRLHIFAHECGHVALDHRSQKPRHRQEYEAEAWARRAFDRHGLLTPRKSDIGGRRYVTYKIAQALRCGAKTIDPDAREFARDFLDDQGHVRRHLATN